MKLRRNIFCLILALCLLLSLVACTQTKLPASESQTTGTDQTVTPSDAAASNVTPQLSDPAPVEPLRAAKDYDEIKAHLLAAVQDETAEPAFGGMEVFNGFDTVKESAAESEAVSDDYSETNVQVEGVDEADIVKTDGKNIFALFGSVVQIIRADSADTKLLSEIYLNAEDENTNINPLELYLDNGKLFILTSKSIQKSEWQWNDQTEVRIYDVSDPKQPTLLSTVGQDGYYQTSRMTDGKLYIATLQFFYEEPGEDWIPRTYCNGEGTLLPAEGFYLCPDCHDTAFTLVGAYDCAGTALSDVCSFTGCCDTIYMSKDRLYLAQSSQDEWTSGPYTEDQYTVTEYQSTAVTRIHRVDLQDGKLTPSGTASVEGTLNNQFSLDEYNGMLRLAMTTSYNSYKIYKDEKHGFENYTYDDVITNNSVIVLDEELNQLGEVRNLVADEQIYSVRFIGDIAYVVTYESIDPVFTIDLSDPANPTVQSALELAGVSNYLQGYGAGLLFGFGQALDENAASQGLQLSMFDVTDPTNVTLLAKSVIEDFGSEAIYNHKALIADPEKNLIMFPGGSSKFYVYSYDNGAFTEKGSFELGAENDEQYWYWEQSRGLYIGENLYLLCDQVIFVVDMNSFETVKTLSLAEG